MSRNPLSPKDLTNVLNRYQGSICRRSAMSKVASNRRGEPRREGSQSTCDRMALGLLICASALQTFAILCFDLF
ncbi:MAG: hypothetical protein LBD40_01440 [Puniceicoccales bacterium]|nr:hypothetical protein [Puniceicoccales bacterium]